MIGMRTRAPKSSEGKMVNGRETLRLRSKGAATVQEVVSSPGKKANSGFVPRHWRKHLIMIEGHIFTGMHV